MSGRRVCTADDFYSLVGLTDPHISPDGKLAVVVETHSHTETDSYRYALRIFDLTTQRDVVLDVAEGTIHSPLFSQDG